MAKRAVVFQHMSDDDLCKFSELLSGDGFAIETVHVYDGQAIPSLADYDLMFVLGGAMDVWQTDEYPWLIAEQEAVREWVADRAKPYVGICLGHQVLASALGGRVTSAEQSEVGQHWISTHADAEHPFFAGLNGRYPAMQWHYAEVVELPEAATPLASSEACEVQAFAIGEHALSLQFHVEWTLQRIRTWPEKWLEALHKDKGEGAHDRIIGDAAQHMPAIDDLRQTLYDNFKRTSGLNL